MLLSLKYIGVCDTVRDTVGDGFFNSFEGVCIYFISTIHDIDKTYNIYSFCIISHVKYIPLLMKYFSYIYIYDVFSYNLLLYFFYTNLSLLDIRNSLIAYFIHIYYKSFVI